MNLANLLGVDASELLGARKSAEGLARDVRRIAEAIEADRGVPPEGTPPPVAGRVPFVAIVEFPEDLDAPDVILGPASSGGREVKYSPNDGRTYRVPIEQRTGRASLRGYVANIGGAAMLARFEDIRGEWSDFIEVPAGATLDYTWAVRAIDLLAITTAAARAQVVAL